MALAPLPVLGEVERARDSSASAPFSGLCICVSGLSKEARTQVMEATQKLGGTYSPNLHPKCTHLLVQSLQGHKLDHAFNYGFRNGLFVVTLGWFIDSVNKYVKLSELPYTVWSVAPVSIQMEDRLLNPTAADESCIQIGLKHKGNQSEERGGQKQWYSRGKFEVNKESQLFGQSIYIDFDVSAELHSKVVDVAAREGAVLVDQWFVGCGASYVVCEGSSTQRYLGHSDNIVSPIWVLKTSKERSMQRFVRFSADLARQVGVMLENLQHVTSGQEAWEENCHEHVPVCNRSKVNQKERLQAANLAKCGIRNRRVRRLQGTSAPRPHCKGYRAYRDLDIRLRQPHYRSPREYCIWKGKISSCQAPLRPINPSSLLDNICWSVSEPTSSAAVYADSLMSMNDFEIHKHGLSVEVGGDCIEPEAAFSNSLRKLTESEKNQLVFKNHFLTILYPVDRFSELGPSSRTYFSDPGFTCLQVLEFIHAFYQENMSEREIEFAIHTDSRHAEKLRSIYCSERTEQIGYVVYKRIEFLGSRKSFEMLKRISGDNNSNVYELLLRE